MPYMAVRATFCCMCRRSAGGVFLTLLKSHASSAEVKQVYAREKAIAKKKTRMGEGKSKARQKHKRKRKGKQECTRPDTQQEEMDEAKHRKVPDRRQLISYKDLSQTHASDSQTTAGTQGQLAMEAASTGPTPATLQDTAAKDSEVIVNEETRLAQEFDSRDAPGGLDGLDLDWY